MRGFFSAFLVDPELPTIRLTVSGVRGDNIGPFVKRVIENRGYAWAMMRRADAGSYEMIRNDALLESRVNKLDGVDADPFWGLTGEEDMEAVLGLSEHAQSPFRQAFDDYISRSVEYVAVCNFQSKFIQTKDSCWIVSVLNAMMHAPCVYRRLLAVERAMKARKPNDSVLASLCETLSEEDSAPTYDVGLLKAIESRVRRKPLQECCLSPGREGRVIELVHEVIGTRIHTFSAWKPYDVTAKRLSKYDFVYRSYLLGDDLIDYEIENMDEINNRLKSMVPSHAVMTLEYDVDFDGVFESSHAVSGIVMDIDSTLPKVTDPNAATPMVFLINSQVDSAPLEFDWTALTKCASLAELHAFKSELVRVVRVNWFQWPIRISEIRVGYIHADDEDRCHIDALSPENVYMQSTTESYDLPTPATSGGGLAASVMAWSLPALAALARALLP